MTGEEKVVFYGGVLVAIILHEISHGVVAFFFGDDTAKRSGRLTLNPIRHIDPFGSIILPALLVVAGGRPFGWAKPVPVDPSKLHNPRRQMIFVGLAGPATNFLLMIGAAVAGRRLVHAWMVAHPFRVQVTGFRLADLPFLAQVFVFFALGNLILGIFNLLPIPPLDGSSLIERVLPQRWLPKWYQLRPYGLIVLLLLVFSTNLLGKVLDPFQLALFHYVGLP